MPEARKQNHKLAAGLLSVAAMVSEPTIRNFPEQADQPPVAWAIDGQRSQPPTRPFKTTTADGVRREFGLYTGSLVFSYLTFGMLNYLNTTLLAFGNDLAVNATIQTYTEIDSLITIQCLIYKPIVEELSSPAPGGYKDVVYRYVNGVVVT